MDADDLETFATVVRAGGFTRAALELRTVQSNITRRIRLLEAELGVSLFDRHARGVRLTKAGELLLPYAERVANLVLEARHAALGLVIPATVTAPARLGMPETLLAFGLAATAEARGLELQTGSTASLVEDVRGRRLDAAIVAGPVLDWELTSTPLFIEELVVVTAPTVSPLHALSATKLLVFPEGCAYRARLEAIVAGRNLRSARWMELGTLDGILALVAAGAGTTLLPRRLVLDAEAAGRVSIRALRAEEARLEIVAVRRSDAASVAIEGFIAVVVGEREFIA